jgi:hypothetical protein
MINYAKALQKAGILAIIRGVRPSKVLSVAQTRQADG